MASRTVSPQSIPEVFISPEVDSTMETNLGEENVSSARTEREEVYTSLVDARGIPRRPSPLHQVRLEQHARENSYYATSPIFAGPSSYTAGRPSSQCSITSNEHREVVKDKEIFTASNDERRKIEELMNNAAAKIIKKDEICYKELRARLGIPDTPPTDEATAEASLGAAELPPLYEELAEAIPEAPELPPSDETIPEEAARVANFPSSDKGMAEAAGRTEEFPLYDEAIAEAAARDAAWEHLVPASALVSKERKRDATKRVISTTMAKFAKLGSRSVHHDDPVESPLVVSLDPNTQARLYTEFELMLITTINAYLVVEFKESRLNEKTVANVVAKWTKPGRLRPKEFMFDLETQLAIVKANSSTLRFFGAQGDDIHIAALLTRWMYLTPKFSHRTLCNPDFEVQNHFVNVSELLALFGAPETAFVKVQDMQAALEHEMTI